VNAGVGGLVAVAVLQALLMGLAKYCDLRGWLLAAAGLVYRDEGFSQEVWVSSNLLAPHDWHQMYP